MRAMRVFFLVSISAFCTVAFASEADNGPYRTIPVYPRGEGTVTLAIDVREVVYPNKPDYRTILSTPAEDGEKGAPTAEIAVAGYIDAIMTQDTGKANELVYGETSMVREQREKELIALGKMWKGITDIRLTRKWSFGDYHHIHIKLVSPKEHLTGWSFDAVMIDGRYYLALDFGKKFNNVLMLFWYMHANIREGLVKSTDCSHLKDTLELADPNVSEQGRDNKLIVRLSANFNKFTEDWSEQSTNAENQASDFFCKARKITLDGTDEEFLSLWSGEEYLKIWSAGIERPKIDNKLLKENYADFKRLRETYGKARFNEQQFKQVCTIDLGKYVVHYYLAKDAPENLKTIIFMKGDGRYYLSEELYTNIRQFLTRGMVPKRILQMWQSQKD